MELPIILIVVFSLIIFTRILTVVVHEMGHAIVGLILFRNDIEVYIGSHGNPEKGLHFKIGRMKVHFKYNPFLWSHGLCISGTREMSFWQGYIFTLAGPLNSLLITIVCFFTLFYPHIHSSLKIIALFLLFS